MEDPKVCFLLAWFPIRRYYEGTFLEGIDLWREIFVTKSGEPKVQKVFGSLMIDVLSISWTLFMSNMV